jgi:hypothetical protein
MYMILMDQDQPNATSARSVDHPRNCVRTAAAVVTSASTVYGDAHEQQLESWDLTSEFAWLAGPADFHSSLTLDWVATQRQGSGTSPSLVADLGRVSGEASTIDANPENRRVVDIQQDEEGHDRAAGGLTESSNAVQVVAPVRKKRRGFSLSKLFSSKSKTVSQGGRSSHSQLCMDDLKVTATGEISMKICFVGDGGTGKTCFLM